MLTLEVLTLCMRHMCMHSMLTLGVTGQGIPSKNFENLHTDSLRLNLIMGSYIFTNKYPQQNIADH